MNYGYRSDGVSLARLYAMDAESKRTVHASKKSDRLGTIELVEKTEGEEVAGSGTRQTKHSYGALFSGGKNGNGGQWFKTMSEAKAKFDSMS